MLHSTSFDTDYNGPLICLQKNQLHSIKHSCMEVFIWPKSTVEKSSKEEMLWQDWRRKNPSLWIHFCTWAQQTYMRFQVRNQKHWKVNQKVCQEKEINARTVLLKKRWHIYCYINVIYILCFLLQRQKRNVLLAAGFFYSWCSTIPCTWTGKQIC